MQLSRWLNLMSNMGLPDNKDIYASLIAAYSEKHRVYLMLTT